MSYDETKPMYLLNIKFEDNSVDQWQTQDLDKFKAAVTQFKMNIGRNARVELGDSNNPEGGFFMVDMKRVFGFRCLVIPAKSPKVEVQANVPDPVDNPNLVQQESDKKPDPIKEPAPAAPVGKAIASTQTNSETKVGEAQKPATPPASGYGAARSTADTKASGQRAA